MKTWTPPTDSSNFSDPDVSKVELISRVDLMWCPWILFVQVLERTWTWLCYCSKKENKITFHMQLLLQLRGKGRIEMQTTHRRQDWGNKRRASIKQSWMIRKTGNPDKPEPVTRTKNIVVTKRTETVQTSLQTKIKYKSMRNTRNKNRHIQQEDQGDTEEDTGTDW